MKPDRRSYNADYKAEAVRLAVERNIVTAVARDLGIGSTTLQRWVDLSMEHPENPFPGNGNARDVEVQILLRENRRLREENEILKKEVVILPKSPILKYAIIRDLSKIYSVSIICRLFTASRSGVIAWMTRGPSKRATSNVALMKLIKKCHVMKRGFYGSHITCVEPHTSGIPCSEKRIARLMKDAGNCGVVLRKHLQNPLDSGHLSMDRDFVQSPPKAFLLGLRKPRQL